MKNEAVTRGKEVGFKNNKKNAEASSSTFTKIKEPNSLPVAIYTCDSFGKINFFNADAALLFGCTPGLMDDCKTIIGQFKINALEGDRLTDNPLLSILEGSSLKDVPVSIIRPDGTTIEAHVTADPLYDKNGAITGSINVFTDIHFLESVQEQAERNANFTRQLQESEERYHKMIEEVEDYAIILLDSEGNIQNWNKGAEKIKGYRQEEIVGKSFRLFYTEEDRKRKLPETLIAQARETGKAIHEGWRVRKGGSKFWGSIVLTALHDEMNNIIGFSKVTRDLTERKLNEDRMKEYTSQLEFQNKELEQFAYIASHDMKEPLRKINFFLSSLIDDPNEILSARVRDYLNRSISSTKRMGDLIRDLLAYSLVSSRKENFEQSNLNDLVEEIALYYKDEIDAKKIQFDIGSLPTINAVTFQIKQLFDNLIGNAVKYKHPDRDLCISISNQIVSGSELNMPESGVYKQYNHIRVSDNGIGFPQEYADKIFDLFQRLHSDTAARGSGVGLTICKKIIQNHKGFVTATGVVNEGATFDIYLPIIKNA